MLVRATSSERPKQTMTVALRSSQMFGKSSDMPQPRQLQDSGHGKGDDGICTWLIYWSLPTVCVRNYCRLGTLDAMQVKAQFCYLAGGKLAAHQIFSGLRRNLNCHIHSISGHSLKADNAEIVGLRAYFYADNIFLATFARHSPNLTASQLARWPK